VHSLVDERDERNHTFGMFLCPTGPRWFPLRQRHKPNLSEPTLPKWLDPCLAVVSLFGSFELSIMHYWLWATGCPNSERAASWARPPHHAAED
jgi:hypothetical protein